MTTFTQDRQAGAMTASTVTPFDRLRYAAVNRLCVELTYGGKSRLIEPYSLRFSSDGSLLLYARKVDGGAVRTYRLDRIDNAKITGIPFVPQFNVEMTQGGPNFVRPLR